MGVIGKGNCLSCPKRSQSLFGSVPKSEEHLITTVSPEVVRFEKGEVIYFEQTDSNSLFTLREGRVKLTRSNLEGEEQIVRLHKDGDLFGHEKLFDCDYQHTAVAITDVEVCRIPVNDIQEVRNKSAAVNDALVTRTCQQMKAIEDQLARNALLEVRNRVAAFVLDWCNHSTEEVDLPLSRRDISNLLAARMETVSKAMSSFRKEGIITQVSQTRIRINDVEALEEIAQG